MKEEIRELLLKWLMRGQRSDGHEGRERERERER